MLDMNSTNKQYSNWEDTKSDTKSELSICPEPPYADRIELALEAWRQGQYKNPKISARYTAQVYRVANSTLSD
jgi:hypothetical protein